MKTDYRKEAGSSYMVISGFEVAAASFSLKMLMSISSQTLIPLKTENLNGKILFLYDISGKQSFKKAFETGKLTIGHLLSLIDSLKRLALELDEHLLDEGMIMLNAETIFLDRSYNEFYFCCHPDAASYSTYSAETFFSSLTSLIDYDDKQLVALTFAINKLFKTDNFTLKDIFQEADRQGAPSHGSDASEPGLAENLPNESFSVAAPEVVKASFFDKAKIYFKNRPFSEIYDAINSGRIIRLIKDTPLPPAAPVYTALADTASFADTESPATISFNETSPYNEISPYDEDKRNLSDTASLNLSDLPFHRLTGIENALGIIVILDHFPFTLGSPKSPADHHLDWPTISRLHCRIYEEDNDTFAIEDLNSKNGTSVNGAPLAPYEKTPLSPGDTIMLSDLRFIFF